MTDLRKDTKIFAEHTHTHTHTHTNCTDRLKRRHNIVYRTLRGDSRRVDSAIVDDWKNNRLLQQIKDLTYVTYIRVIRNVYFHSTT
jgi:hypothetical protein